MASKPGAGSTALAVFELETGKRSWFREVGGGFEYVKFEVPVRLKMSS